MSSKCWNCGENYSGLYCLKCGDNQEKNSAQNIVVIPPQSTSVEKRSNPNKSINPHDVTVPIEKLESHLQDLGPHQISMRGVFIHGHTDEEKIWSGSPDWLVVINVVIPWVPKIILAYMAPIMLKSALLHVSPPLLKILLTSPFAIIFNGSPLWMSLWFFCASLHIGLYYLALLSMRYRVTTQRLEITDGLLNQQVRTYEMHHLGDVTINSPFPLSLFGLSSLKIPHRHGKVNTQIPEVRIFHRLPDNATPNYITLLGIPQKEARLVRDFIRNSSQIEAGRLDKMRYRN